MTERPTAREPYREPEIVDVGSVQRITSAGDTPVRDNPGVDPPDYHNPNPPETQSW